jgi:choline-sulfatase
MQQIVPTTLAWANADSEGVEFDDLSPLLKHPEHAQVATRAIYGGYLDRQRMIASGDWKLIVYPTLPRFRLFHVKNDPQEMTDLADQPEYRDRAERLLEELRQLQVEMGDPLQLPDLHMMAPARRTAATQ